MITTYDASGLIFSGTPNGVAYSVHASGTYTWDAVNNTGEWALSVPYDPNNHNFDLAGWFNGFGGAYPISTTFSPTLFEVFYPNSGVVNGDISINFASPLGASQDAVTGTFNVQYDPFYQYTGTISGYLAPVMAPVPLPSSFILLIAGMLTLAVLGAVKRRVYSPTFSF